jgi:hypothetical protein
MIFFLAATFLLLVYLFPVFVARLRRDRGSGEQADLFGPVNFLALFGILGIPYLYLLAFDRQSLFVDVRHTQWITDLDRDVVLYVALMAAIYWATLLGLRSRFASALARHVPRLGRDRFTAGRTGRGALVALAGGFVLWAYYIQSVGGLRNLWVNMALRTLLGAGKGYLSTAFMALLYFAAVLLVYRLRFRNTLARRAGLALALLAISFVLASGGGRTPLLELVVLCFLTHHYGVRRRRRIFTPGTTLLALALVGFVLVIPLFRSAGRFDRYSQDPVLLAQDAGRSLSLLAPQFSAFDRTSIMLEYFTVNRMWGGRSWIDLAFAPMPRKLYRRKPPVDDGIYFKEIVDGHQVVPPVPASRMQPTSWPMGNLVLYMNFGLPGLLLGSWLAGVFLGASYRYLRDSGYTPFAVIIYEVFARLGLSLSVWGITWLVMTFALAAIFFWTTFARRRWLTPLRAGVGRPALA